MSDDKASSTAGKLEAVKELVEAIPSRIFKKEALGVLVLLTAGAFGGVAGVAWGQSKFDAGVKLGAAAEVRPVAIDLEEHKREAVALWAARREEFDRLERKVDEDRAVNARRFEVLVNTVLTRQLQPGTAELARVPEKDGGP